MSVSTTRRRALLCTCLVCVLVYVSLSLRYEGNVRYSLITSVWNSPKLEPIISHERWIVITSIADEVPVAVRRLLEEQNWLLVVVADKKGPKKRWPSHPRLHFLSVEDQLALRYRILQHVPYNSYTRKMIGYLYAIQHGAQWIYDTDDDNSPINLGLKQFDYDEVVSGMLYQKMNIKNTSWDIMHVIFNPYSYFGRPDMWPRGYPLTQLQTSNEMYSHRVCKAIRRPLVQQGLVAKDPDVDAIYRLINADRTDGLNVHFDPHAPPVFLKPGVYSPFNSQNTLFHRDAFFTLWLPITVAFRVTDIWRGYFAQRLLHLIGGIIGFYPVNAIQKRNAHNYLADFKEEKALYYDAERLVEVLTNWSCVETSVELCLIELTKMLVKYQFWDAKELDLARAWISDLHSIGYHFPVMANVSKIEAEYDWPNCRRAYLAFDVTADPKQSRNEDVLDLYEWCNDALDEGNKFPATEYVLPAATKVADGLRNKTLIITSNYKFISSISVLQRLYGGSFAHIIFCGPFYPQFIYQNESGFLSVKSLSYIHLNESEMHRGYFAYYCTSKAIELRLQNIDGFIVIADDAIYNLWNWVELNRFRINSVTHNPNNIWWKSKHGATAINATIAAFMKTIANGPDSKLARAWRKYSEEVGGNGTTFLEMPNIWGVSDWYYVPAENFTIFYELAEQMFEYGVFIEIAVPKIGAGLKWLNMYLTGDLDLPSGLHIWHNRDRWFEMYDDNMLYLHPVKLSPYGNDLTKRNKFCRTVVAAFRDNLWNIGSKSMVTSHDSQNDTEDGLQKSDECCMELKFESCQRYCKQSQNKQYFIYDVLTSNGACKESSLSIIAYFNCRIEHAAGNNSKEIFVKPTQNSNITVPDQVEDPGNEEQNSTLDLLTALQNSSSFGDGMTVKQELVQNCCRKNAIRRTKSGNLCMHFCNGNFVLELVEKKKYLDCMDFMSHIVNCYRNVNYTGHFIRDFSGSKDL